VKTRLFGLAVVLGALGAGFCCLGPVIFSVLGVSTVASLTALSWIAPYRNVFFAVTVVALALAFVSVIVRRGRVSRLERRRSFFRRKVCRGGGSPHEGARPPCTTSARGSTARRAAT